MLKKFYAYRDFEVYDDENNLCIIATSKWLLVNNQTGKIARVDPKMAAKYESETEKSVFPEKEISKLKEPEGLEKTLEYVVQRKDIDVIGHMHNLYYLNLAYEGLPEEVYQKDHLMKLELCTKKK